jgi:hypothetical protein
MSSLTSRLKLYKPATSGEAINVATDLNNNLDLIDADLGFIPCTNATRPASTFNGMHIFETDTGRAFVSDGSTPASASWKNQFFVVNKSAQASAGANSLAWRVSGDTQDRYAVGHDGKLNWGTGSATPDTNLYRDGVGVLVTNSSLVIGGGGLVLGGVDLGGVWSAWTPTLTGFTLGSGAVTSYRFKQLGKIVWWQIRIQFGTSPSITTTALVSLPVAARTGGGTNIQDTVGTWTFRDDSAVFHYSGSCGVWASGGAECSFNGAWDGTAPRTRITTAIPFTVASSDVLSASGVYEAA